MKKIVIVLLVLVLSICTTLAAAADNSVIVASGSQTADMQVSVSIDEQYVVTIPSSVELTVNENDVTGSIKVEASDVVLYPTNVLNIAITSADGYVAASKQFRMTDDNGCTTDLNISCRGDKYELNQKIGLALAGQTEGSATFNLSTEKPDNIAGRYETTLTFTVSSDVLK